MLGQLSSPSSRLLSLMSPLPKSGTGSSGLENGRAGEVSEMKCAFSGAKRALVGFPGSDGTLVHSILAAEPPPGL